MIEKQVRKIFIFDMADYINCQFLDRHGNKTKDFTDDCIFSGSKEANSVIEKAEEKYPNSNFQLDLVPIRLTHFFYKNECFWNLWKLENNPLKPKDK